MGKRNKKKGRKGGKKGKDNKRKKRSKRSNKRNKNTRTDRGSSGSSRGGSYGTPRTQKRSSSSKKKKSGKKKGGSKSTRREGDRIKDQLKIREQQGKDKANKWSNTKNERRPKNIGRDGERGQPEREEQQKRNQQLMDNAVNRALEQQELVNSRRFGPLEQQYENAMKKLGDVSGINQQLAASIEELKLSNRRDREAFNNESLRNQDLINSMEASSQRQMEYMQARAADDRALYKQQLEGLNSRYAQQNALAAEQQRLQAVQAKKAQNLANAYVPTREESLGSVSYGDNRKKKRKAKDNRLSDLRVNSQVGTVAKAASQALAGLQLA